MKYLRIVQDSPIPEVGYREGFFPAAYQLRRAGTLSESTTKHLSDCLEWLDDNLDEPNEFSKSNSKGAWRRNTKGLSWFKTSAKDQLDKALELARLLEMQGFSIAVLRTNRPGYIVYEDDIQIVAEPFSDTPR